jgi:hypothetical protein
MVAGGWWLVAGVVVQSTNDKILPPFLDSCCLRHAKNTRVVDARQAV